MVDQAHLVLVFLPQRAQRIRKGRKTDHGITTARKANTLPVAPPIQLFPHSVRSEILVKANGADTLRLQRSRTLLSVFCQGTLCFWRFLPERMSAQGGSGAICACYFYRKGRKDFAKAAITGILTHSKDNRKATAEQS